MVEYFATPSGPDVRRVMEAGDLHCMTTPAQGNQLPDGCLIGVDNGKFGKGYPGDGPCLDFFEHTAERYGRGRITFAVVPDEPFDSVGTLALFRQLQPAVQEIGVPVAFAAQDGCDVLGVPWDDLDVLFLAGSTEWKIGPIAERLAREARERGRWVHMGRVNSFRRLRIAEWFGCNSADGTFLAHGPDKNLPQLLRWLDRIHHTPSLFSS